MVAKVKMIGYIDNVIFIKLKQTVILITENQLNKSPQQGTNPSQGMGQKSKGGFDPFPNRKGLVERTPLIKHAGPHKTQEDIARQQNQERSHTNAENQAYLKDVINHVLAGEGIGWLKMNRFKKLMEDESYRTLVLSKLNKTLDKRIAPDDHIDDVVNFF